MPAGLGLRFVVEAAFILVVAVAAGLAGLGTWTIVLIVGAAWILMSGIEWAASKRPAEPRAQRADTSFALPPRFPAAPPPLPDRAREPGAESPRPAPQQPERPQLTSVPAPPPPPQPRYTPPPPAPTSSVTSLASRDLRPREWNVWELERVVRAATVEPQREQELNYLLMYLREFANADGALPTDFDALVRDSFADLLAAASR